MFDMLTQYTDANMVESGWSDDTQRKAFIAFMRRADHLVGTLTGMGVEDFADADWSSLFEETDGKASPQDIIDLLADADDIFAAMVAL
jgi:hypothetical protein